MEGMAVEGLSNARNLRNERMNHFLETKPEMIISEYNHTNHATKEGVLTQILLVV